MFTHDHLKEWLGLLESSSQAAGLTIDWCITVKRSKLHTGLSFTCIGYPGPNQPHIIACGPDAATAIQRAQGYIQEAARNEQPA